jgi:predicted NBD/HSP70 family sugar kinase
MVNRCAVLRSLHFDGPQRRAELSRRCAIRKTSVTNIVAELLGTGLVIEEEPESRRSRVALDSERFHVLAANVSPGAVRVARVFLDGRVEDLEEHKVAVPSAPERVARLLGTRLAKMRKKNSETMGASVAIPGLVEPETGGVIYSVRLGQWRDVPFADLVEKHAGASVLVDNDVRCQLWSCAWFDRHIAGLACPLYLGILDGVACSTIVHGRRVLGGRHAAGEIGHVRAGDDGRLCPCGKTDCLESYASVPAILGELKSLRPELALRSAADIAKAASGDRAVENVLDRVAMRLARAVAGIVAALDPEVLVVGSADREFSGLLRPLLQRHLRAELMGLDARDTEVMIADPVDLTTLTGVGALVIDKVFRLGPASKAGPA